MLALRGEVDQTRELALHGPRPGEACRARHAHDAHDAVAGRACTYGLQRHVLTTRPPDTMHARVAPMVIAHHRECCGGSLDAVSTKVSPSDHRRHRGLPRGHQRRHRRYWSTRGNDGSRRAEHACAAMCLQRGRQAWRVARVPLRGTHRGSCDAMAPSRPALGRRLAR